MTVPLLDRNAPTLAALKQELAGLAVEADRRGRFPRAALAPLRAAGLLGLTVPARFGGGGAGLVASARAVGAIAEAEPSTALVVAMQHLHHAAFAATERWPVSLHERVACEAVTDGALINSLRVEPALGTPARGGLPATVARRVPAGWSISGHKIFSTGIPVLRWLLVWARSDDAEPLTGAWLVPAEAPGVTVLETWDHLGMRATEGHDVVLKDVVVPAEYAVDVRPAAEKRMLEPVQLTWNSVLMGALYNGIAIAARDWLVGYLHRRTPSGLGASLASVPRIQSELGEIAALVRTNERLLRSAAAAVDAGSADAPDVVEAGVLKRATVGGAIEAVQRAVALVGNAGLSRANPLERHLRDVLCGRIHTPQDDMVLLAAGQAALAPFADAPA